MCLNTMSWLSLWNLQFFCMTQNISWMSMNYKHDLKKMVPRKGQHGKMFPLLRRDSLLLFLRTKNFYKGGVMPQQGS